MINKTQLRNLVKSTLTKYNLYSKSAENLVMGTIAQESKLGYYLRQISKGDFDINKHALGISQMEHTTFEWLKEKFWFKVNLRSPYKVEFVELEYNLEMSILFCRLRYLADSKPLPDAEDIKGIAQYYKRVYNTASGAATEQEFIDNYLKYCGEK